MKAIVINGKTAKVVHDRSLPQLRHGYLLVKPVAIALNPTDWKHIYRGLAADNGLSGCDYAGVVEDIGQGVTTSWKVGDRICGCAHGANFSNVEDGAFAEHIVVKADVQMKIPDNLTFEQAATVGLGALTCAQGLYQALGLNLPMEPAKDGEYVLIYGGSSATGSLGVQYAKLSGYKVLTTCSIKNFEYVKNLGVEEAFDYNDKDCGAKIREYTKNKLKYAWDTIALESSAQICADALSTEAGCKYANIGAARIPRDDVESSSTLMYTMIGDSYKKGGKDFPANQQHFDFAKKFMKMTESLLAEGKLKPHREKVGAGGLAGALEGMKEMQAGKVSAEKLVYIVADTT